MAAPIKVCGDLSSDELRAFARTSKDAGQVRRLLALAAILDGSSRSEAARIAGVTLQIVRDWVLRFNEAGISGLATRKAPGPSTILDDCHRRALAEIIDAGPIPAVHGVVRWRIINLAQWLWDEFEISISKQALGHELRTMGYRKLSARPRHRGQKEGDIAIFKKA
ncbi:helix-turn-helix domain-containing protein, partial [Erythrobacter sp. WG]|uniref:helix-turn-helix domain-containing protein n=1 Tax=Erythrobacter sp. WG TaxID=2985510 RepID=UPI0022719404